LVDIQITIIDYVLAVFYLTVIFFIAFYYQSVKIKDNREYIYFTPGLVTKIFGGLLFTYIYLYYYRGGDTISYFISAKSLANLFFKDIGVYFSILSGHLTSENWSYFDANTGYPLYYRDHWAFAVVRITSIFIFFGAKSILSTIILLSAVSYIGIWKLFRFIYKEFPQLKTQIAVAILFYPSVIFWGTGILKDTYTLIASAFSFIAFYSIIVYNKNFWVNLFVLFIAAYIIMMMKPYIFFIQFAVFIIVFVYIRIGKVKSMFLRFIVLPFVIVGVFGVGIAVFSSLSKISGQFYSSLNDVLTAASVKQNDLTQAYYGGNSFNIGYFEPTLQGVLSKFFPAVNAGIFRPYLWEANNVVMIISGLETFILLLFSLWIFINLLKILFFRGFRWIIHFFFTHPLIVYSLFYSIFFAFAIGLTTANFGALVRYKIPFLPYFLLLLFILNYYIKKAGIV